MANLKSFDQFCNENLVVHSENYNYFGQGSLDPIIQQLIGEGKNASIIRSYLTSLGVDQVRVDNALAKFTPELAIGESKKKVNETTNLNEKVLKKDKDKEKAAQGGADVFVDDTPVDFVASFPAKDWKKQVKVHSPDNGDMNAEGMKSNELVFVVADQDSGNTSFTPANYVEVIESTKVDEAKVKETFEEKSGKFLKELNKQTFEDVADMFVKKLNEEDDEKVDEKLNKKTLQVEADGEDIDDMIDDLEDGDEDEFSGPDDTTPDDGPEQKIKDGESPADAVEDDNASNSDKLDQATKELKKDSDKLEKIKKLLGEAEEMLELAEKAETKKNEGDTIELDDDGELEKDAENIEVADSGDEVEVEDEVEESKKVVEADDDWSEDVKTKWHPPAGLFTEPASKIADVLAKASKDLDQAMARLTFYINRAGKLLKPKDKANLESVKALLRKKFNA